MQSIFPLIAGLWLFQDAAALKLNVTAIGAQSGSSTLECWQMDQPFATSSTPGTSGSAQTSLDKVSSLSYTIIPSNFDGGIHHAPANQYVLPCPLCPLLRLLSTVCVMTCMRLLNLTYCGRWVVFTTGLAYITLPDDNQTSAYVNGGQFGLIFAADTKNVSREGHRTQYPGVTETIALQIPTKDGKIPKHRVLHLGPCSISEVTGARDYAVAISNGISTGPAEAGCPSIDALG